MNKIKFCGFYLTFFCCAQKKVSKEKGVRPAKKLPCFCCGRRTSMCAGFSLPDTNFLEVDL